MVKVFIEWVSKSFEQMDVFTKRVSKSFERLDISTEQVIKPFERMQIFFGRMTQVVRTNASFRMKGHNLQFHSVIRTSVNCAEMGRQWKFH